MALDVRAAAAEVIAEVLGGKSLNQALPPRLNKVSPRDRALLQQLSYGSLRHGPRLQALLEQLLDKPLRAKDRDVQALLLCGAAGSSIPPSAPAAGTAAFRTEAS